MPDPQAVEVPEEGEPLPAVGGQLGALVGAAVDPPTLNPVGQYQPGDLDYVADCDQTLTDCAGCAAQAHDWILRELDSLQRLATAIAEQATATVLLKMDRLLFQAQATAQVLTEDLHQSFVQLWSMALQAATSAGFQPPPGVLSPPATAAAPGGFPGSPGQAAAAGVTAGAGFATIGPGGPFAAVPTPASGPNPTPPGVVGTATPGAPGGTFLPPQLGGLGGPLVSSTSAGGPALAAGGPGGSGSAVGIGGAGGAGGAGGSAAAAAGQLPGAGAAAQIGAAAGGNASIIEPPYTGSQISLPGQNGSQVFTSTGAPESCPAPGPALPTPVDIDQPYAFKFSPDDAQWKAYALYFGGGWLQRYQAAPTLKAFIETRPADATGEGIVPVYLDTTAPPPDEPPEPPNFQFFGG